MSVAILSYNSHLRKSQKTRFQVPYSAIDSTSPLEIVGEYLALSDSLY